jgi:hypothetical protein
MSMILEKEEKREGVKKKLEGIRKKYKADEEKYELLTDKTNWTTGVLAANGMYTFSRKQILDNAKSVDAAINHKNQQKQNRDDNAKTNLDKKVAEAVRRYRENLSFHTIDYQALVKEFAKITPRSRLAEVEQHYNKKAKAPFYRHLRKFGVMVREDVTQDDGAGDGAVSVDGDIGVVEYRETVATDHTSNTSNQNALDALDSLILLSSVVIDNACTCQTFEA